MLVGITGSHGFIGRNLADSLSVAPDAEIRCFDREKQSLFDILSLKDFVEGLDVLFHAAGANRAENSELIRVNVLGTSNLIEAVKRYGRPNDLKFIYISSFQVYPSFQSDYLINEEVMPAPDTLFGVTKKCSEELIRISEINNVIVRLSNTYGPHCRPFYNSVISTFCRLISEDKEITVNGKGNQTRDFIFIDDVVSALTGLMRYPCHGKDILNLCSGELFSLNDIIKELERIARKRIKIRYKESDECTRFQRGDNRRIRDTLEWSAKTSFAQGIEKTYRWFEGR